MALSPVTIAKNIKIVVQASRHSDLFAVMLVSPPCLLFWGHYIIPRLCGVRETCGRRLWVVSGPSSSYQLKGRFPGWISTGRRNTLTKTQKMACMLMNQRRRGGLYGGRESGAVGPLEASRGAEFDWASVWRTLIVCLSPVPPEKSNFPSQAAIRLYW